MNELGDTQQKHLDYLLADFAAIKAEIGRRSTLQRAVLVAYVAVLAVEFQRAASSTLSTLWIVALWAASALAFQFYAREALEIARLGTVIRERIALVASEIIGAPADRLLPSETNAEIPATLSRRRFYDSSFNWVVFFAAPALVTLIYAGPYANEIRRLWDCSTVTPWAALLGTVGAVRVFVLLTRHA